MWSNARSIDDKAKPRRCVRARVSEWERAPPRVVGHRGSPREAIENTLASFHAAARHVRAVELDARLSHDDEVVVHHDVTLGRAVRGDEDVDRLTAAELRARGVPLLREVLDLPLLVNVEIKGDATRVEGIAERVAAVVRRADAVDRVLVSSFDHELADAYARATGGSAGMIVPFAPEPADLDSYPRLGCVMLADDAALDEVLAAIRAAGKAVYVWTVNDDARAAQLLRAGAAGVITDRPGPLARSLGEAASAP